jgi:hypothetical protein
MNPFESFSSPEIIEQHKSENLPPQKPFDPFKQRLE